MAVTSVMYILSTAFFPIQFFQYILLVLREYFLTRQRQIIDFIPACPPTALCVVFHTALLVTISQLIVSKHGPHFIILVSWLQYPFIW